MSKLYRSREGDVTAADTKTQLTTLGSQTAPGPLLVPSGAKSLSGIVTAFMSNFAAANDCSVIVRLEGPGLPEGPETFVIGAAGGAVATGGAQTARAERFALDVPVTPANEILVFAEMTGEDVGQLTAGVTLEFTT